jgi:hypothetical protein
MAQARIIVAAARRAEQNRVALVHDVPLCTRVPTRYGRSACVFHLATNIAG